MKGILFKPEMIQQIVNGSKSVTRRVIKPQPIVAENYKGITIEDLEFDGFKPHYHVGEVVYVKEAWCESYYGEPICYKLDGGESPGPKGFWRSPLFMPARAARYFIRITDAKPQRLQEVTTNSCKLEGISDSAMGNAIQEGYPAIKAFADLWDSINPRYLWESNPWVFVYSFKLVEKEV